LCVECGIRPLDPPTNYCIPCRKENAKRCSGRYGRLKKFGLCRVCGRDRKLYGARCFRCIPVHRERVRETRRGRLEKGLCVNCGEYPHRKNYHTCEACGRASRSRAKERILTLKKSGLCVSCGRRKAYKASVRCKSCYRRYLGHSRRRHEDERLGKSSWYHKVRAEAIARYGGQKCACCGEQNSGFLTIDHINSDGNVHRKSVGAGTEFVSWLARNGFPPGFQVLCYNCNCGRARNGGICPHAAT
jgi:hypothetical protein